MPYKDPEAAREYQRDRKRIERASGRTSHVQPVPLPNAVLRGGITI